MEPKDQWVHFKEIDWNCPNNNRFNVDTRDFFVGYNFGERHKDWNTIRKYDHFFFTDTELIELLDRLFEESGGHGEWRMMDLDSEEKSVKNWMLKYLRIFRTNKGFLVCNSDEKALSKELLSSKVDQRFLNHH